MAAQTAAGARVPGAGRGGGKPFRIAGYNGWLVLGGLAAAIVVGLYLRNKLSGTSTTTATSPATTDTSGAGSGGGGSGSPTDLTPVEDLASAINGLIPILSSNFNQPPVAPASTTPDQTQTQTVQPSSNTAPLGNIAPGTPGTGTIFINGVNTGIPDTAANATSLATAFAAGTYAAPTTVKAATVPSAPTTSATNVQPYGGIVSTRTLANGAKLTTYASGRQVEQVPGKTPYVVKA